MNFNKNIAALAICLAMFSPIKSNDSEEINKLTGIEEAIATEVAEEAVELAIQEATTVVNSPEGQALENEAVQAVNSTPVQEVVNNVEQVIEAINSTITVSTDEASALIADFNNNLTHGNKFTINNMEFVVDATRVMNAAEENVIETILSYIIDSAISTVSQIMTTIPTQAPVTTQAISQQAATALLEQVANGLVAGSQFSLNGTSYVVEATSTNN
ncbi:MAG: hypothetical protein JO129_02280 [Candidatus Dependentiae bacterium]|nr:hypothetical protein [Candidatus Dependentiae bacterium]